MAAVSVIIPCYNAADYIEHCLMSFEKQTYRDFDIIVIDDCSNDDTENVITNFIRNSKLAIYYQKNATNLGPAGSRNKGIQFSKSNYICFCDSDDWYDEAYIQSMISKAQNSDADIVLCGYKAINENTGRVTNHPLLLEENQPKEKYFVAQIDALWKLMIRREIAVANPIPNLRNGEDMAIIPIYIDKSEKIAIVNNCIYNYVTRTGSLSTKSSREVINSLRESFRYIKEYFGNKHRDEVEFLGIRNYIYGATLCAFKTKISRKQLFKILDGYESEYKTWQKNKYIKELSLYKRVYLATIKNRLYVLGKILAIIHKKLTA